MPHTETVLVPRWALEFILENGCFQDVGPHPEGWSSEAMRRALDELRRAAAQGGLNNA